MVTESTAVRPLVGELELTIGGVRETGAGAPCTSSTLQPKSSSCRSPAPTRPRPGAPSVPLATPLTKALVAFSPAQRSVAIHRLAEVLESHADETGALDRHRSRFPGHLTESLQVHAPINHLRHYAEAATRIADEHLGSHFDPVASASVVAQRPAGVVAAITAYNYPLLLAISKIGAALAAGCTVVLLRPDGRRSPRCCSAPSSTRPHCPGRGQRPRRGGRGGPPADREHDGRQGLLHRLDRRRAPRDAPGGERTRWRHARARWQVTLARPPRDRARPHRAADPPALQPQRRTGLHVTDAAVGAPPAVGRVLGAQRRRL